jgi:hypothetical protein
MPSIAISGETLPRKALDVYGNLGSQAVFATNASTDRGKAGML